MDLLLINGNVEVLFVGIVYYDIDYFVEVEVIKLIGEFIVFLILFSVYVFVGLYLLFFIIYIMFVIFYVLYLFRVNEIFLGLVL